MSKDQLSSFQLVYNSCPSFWTNYDKANSWLKAQGFNPINFNFQLTPSLCPRDEHGHDNHHQNKPDSNIPESSVDTDQEDSYVDDDYVRFIIETRKHQKEQERLRALRIKKEKKEEIVYKDIGEIDVQRLTKPEQFKHTEKDLDHINLYGNLSESIKAKEALLQSDFNVYYDTHKPQFWPTIPVKIK